MSSLLNQPKQYIDSETYRKMLVQDGEKRFKEWHNSFLNYQKEFLQDLKANRQR